MSLPDIALSVRQPWAWAIMHGKDIENRSWHSFHGARRRAPIGKRVCIHAAQGLTRDEYKDAKHLIHRLLGSCPEPGELVRGAIIGTVRIVEGLTKSNSPWFFGPYGLVLADPEPLEVPIRSQGALGWFEWKAADLPPPAPAKWMQPKSEALPL